MGKEGYQIKDIYQGGYSSFDSSYGNVFTGYRLDASKLGAPTKPDTANQIQQVSNMLNQGMVPIEVGALSPDIFETIPKQDFKEINRLAKLTGAKVSVHAPIIEPSGIDSQRGGWNESQREFAEMRFKNVIDRVQDMNQGGMPIVFHAANMPGTEWKMVEEDGKRKKQIDQLIAINRESGQLVPLRWEDDYHPIRPIPEDGKVKIADFGLTKRDPLERLRMQNNTQWNNSVKEVFFEIERASRILDQNYPLVKEIYKEVLTDPKKWAAVMNQEDSTQKKVFTNIFLANEHIEKAEQQVNSLFSKAYEFGSKENQKVLKQMRDNYVSFFKFKDKSNLSGDDLFDLQHDPLKRLEAAKSLAIGIKGATPDMFVPIEEFAREQSSKTFGNVAIHAYKKFKDKAPKIAIENLFPGMAHSTGKEMAELVEASRKSFVEQAMKPVEQNGLGMKESEAKKRAEEIIGMTFDVGHLNIAKKHGFTDKDLLNELKEMSKYVKHVHLTDNFGYADTHLPPGMGNVPFKEFLAELEKAGYSGNAIVEAGGFVQHFQRSPYLDVLNAMGSPIYSMDMAPYWNQSLGLYQGYSSGYGMMLPQTNYNMFGAGFSQLPIELGGDLKPGGSRMSGRPME